MNILIDDNSYILGDTKPCLTKGLQCALRDLVAADQHSLGQRALRNSIFGHMVSAFPADLTDMKQRGIVLETLLKDTFESGQAVRADASVFPVVDSADVADVCIPLLIQQISHSVLQTPVEINLDLIKFIVVLIRVDKDDGKSQCTQKINLCFAERAKGNDTVYRLRLVEGKTHENDIVLIRHHLYKTGQR